MRLGRIVGFTLGAVLTVGVGLFIFAQFPMLERLARTRILPPMGGQ